MEKLNNIEAELKKSNAYKRKSVKFKGHTSYRIPVKATVFFSFSFLFFFVCLFFVAIQVCAYLNESFGKGKFPN